MDGKTELAHMERDIILKRRGKGVLISNYY